MVNNFNRLKIGLVLIHPRDKQILHTENWIF